MELPAGLREKYDHEREKRLRPDKMAQYSDIRDPMLHDLNIDPWVDHAALAAHGYPLVDGSEVKVLILGAGFFGLMTAHKLITEGAASSRDIVLVDRAGGVGGTWYWNRYPGVGCDIEAYCYLPLLEETGYIPKERYAPGHEIREQCERIVAKWDMQTQLCTKVLSKTWNNDAKRWAVKLEHDLGPAHPPRHLTVQAQFVVLGSGVLTVPHAPTLNGVDVFRSEPGKTLLHTGRWDWSKSGGSQECPDLSLFEGKKVGVIGTGATGIQLIPHVARRAAHTYVFQRTPSYVGFQLQNTTTPEDWARVACKKGWQYERIASLDSMFTAEPGAENLVQDSWSVIPGMIAFMGHSGKVVEPADEEKHVEEMLRLDYPWAEEMRARVDSIVQDKPTAEALKPWYPSFCKRPTFSNEYLGLFNRPDVTLVDTDGKGVEAYTSNGVRASGQEYELDVLVLATGYTVAALIDGSPDTIAETTLLGRGGRSLKNKWEADDFGTLFGQMSNGFPNLFFFTAHGASFSHNALSAFEICARCTSHVIREGMRRSDDPGRAVIEVSKETEDDWGVKLSERAGWFAAMAGCTPGFINGEGLMQERAEKLKTDEEKFQAGKRTLWGGGVMEYRRIIGDWISTGRMEGVEVR